MDGTTKCGFWDKMKTCQVAMADLAGLPTYYSEIIPEAYMDKMGHMNVRYYLGIFDTTTWRLFAEFGLNDNYFESNEKGVFALKQHLQYLAEVRPGQKVVVRARMLGLTEKRIHLMNFMINEDTGELAATIESLITHADLKLRKAAPLPPDIAARFRNSLDKDLTLDWDPPVSGAI